jgi:hypothetical protein
MKRILVIGALLVASGGMLVAKANARPVEKTMIKVPFAFLAGNQALPAGTYEVEMLTQSKPGQDAIEVIAFRGKDTRSYATFLAFLGEGDAKGLSLTFRRDGKNAVLTEVEVTGKSFRLAPWRYAKDTAENAALYETISADEPGMLSLGQ